MVSYKLPHIFSRADEKQKRLFKLLQHAYIDARYKEDYSIHWSELEALTLKVKASQAEVERLCEQSWQASEKRFMTHG